MKTIKVSESIYEKIKDLIVEDESPLRDLGSLVGKLYTFWCTRYTYHGVVKSVTKTFITLENASVVFETGEYSAKTAADIQKLPYDCNVMVQSIESFQKMNW